MSGQSVKVIAVCGRICCGKTTYARGLCERDRERDRERCGAILLSVDEIMLAVFGQHAGERHDEYAAGVRKYLLAKSVELIKSGVSVVLDWGFWRRADREEIKSFYASCGVPCEMHYLDISGGEWERRIGARNASVEAGNDGAYYIDENLAAKFSARFEEPERGEIDLWVTE